MATNKTRRMVAVAVLGTMIASAAAGCGNKTLTFNGSEISKPEDIVKSADNQWANHVASGKGVSKAEGSRCYFQVKDETVNDQMLCGPVARLGQDGQGWDMVRLSGTTSGGKIHLSTAGEFLAATRQEGTDLYRPDGKKHDESITLSEPDVPAAELGKLRTLKSAKASASPTPSSSAGGNLKNKLITPAGSVTFGPSKISDRVGGPEDRVKAPDGAKFVSFTVATDSPGYGSDTKKSASYFIKAGKDRYEVAGLIGPAVAIAIPGDGKGVQVEAVFDGLTQSYDLDKAERIGSAAAGYYTDLQDEPKKDDSHRRKLLWGDAQNRKAANGTIEYTMSAERLAYAAGHGWPAEGKTWLRVNFATSQEQGNGGYQNYSELKNTFDGLRATASGEEIPPAKVEKNSGLFSSGTNIYFQIPAGANSISIKGPVKQTGERPRYTTDGPLALEASYEVPATTLEFAPRSAS